MQPSTIARWLSIFVALARYFWMGRGERAEVLMRRRGLAWVLVVMCSVVALGLSAWSTSGAKAPQPGPRQASAALSRAVAVNTFVSLVPACGCARSTELDEFSTVTGGLTRRLGAVALPSVASVDAPAVKPDGRLLITVSTGWRCDAHGAYAECPRIAPNSCTNSVLSDAPEEGNPSVAFTVSGRSQINDAVPSPNGRSVAFGKTPCTNENGLTGLFVRNQGASGRERLLFGRRNACDEIDRPSWNAAGDRLLFVYNRALSPPTAGPAGGIRACGQSRSEMIVTTVASPHVLRTIRPQHGCVFKTAAYDGPDLVAIEGCDLGGPVARVGTTDAQAYLVRVSRTGQRLQRWTLRRGLEDALITPEPGRTRLLITQDLPANSSEPEADWVWELDGTHLRLIRHYKANDAAQVLAVGY
jgi:hypothetical protein